MHQARKRFGQHFLHDPNVIGRIVAAIDPQPHELIVEIGPGLGALTLPVLKLAHEMHAVEIDRDVIPELLRQTREIGVLQVHEADVLKFDFAALRRDDAKLRLIGNLPYNISTPLLFRLIEQRQLFRDMHFMLQKEVVERMAAAPGGKDYGRLTVMLAPWLNVEPLFDIGPGAFRPPPKVISTVVRLTPHASAPFVITDHAVFGRVVLAAFSQRRKTLRNALRGMLSTEQIVAAGVNPDLRAEVLAPTEFAALARQVAC